jgi:hypothetical protein
LEKWIEGTHEELKALREYGVYHLVPRSEVPLNKTILNLKPVYTCKRDMAGTVVRNKVRYCILGNRQIYGRDYTRTTSPTAHLESFRTVLYVAASNGWDIQQVDVKTAFLNADLPPEEYQYARQPRNFEEKGKESCVWKVVKSLYGLKQAGRAWNKHMHEAMLEWGFRHLVCKWCVYICRLPDGGANIVAMHVDDILSAVSTVKANDAFKAQLRSKWAITDLSDIKFCLGIAVVRDAERRTISLSQTALIDRIVEQFNQHNAYPVATPMETKLNLHRPSTTVLSREEADQLATIPYHALVGSLMYLAIGTRPDIAYPVNRLAGFLSNYSVAHWQAAIRVVRYLKGTRSLTLTLGGTDPISLSGQTDSDYVNDKDGRRSIMGYVFSLGSGAISWVSQKQKAQTAD